MARTDEFLLVRIVFHQTAEMGADPGKGSNPFPRDVEDNGRGLADDHVFSGIYRLSGMMTARASVEIFKGRMKRTRG
jgi:hypothetical protein